jgi:hypothetical protein
MKSPAPRIPALIALIFSFGLTFAEAQITNDDTLKAVAAYREWSRLNPNPYSVYLAAAEG